MQEIFWDFFLCSVHRNISRNSSGLEFKIQNDSRYTSYDMFVYLEKGTVKKNSISLVQK